MPRTFRQEKWGRPARVKHPLPQAHPHPAPGHLAGQHRVTWQVDEDVVARDAASDGCFPLITNDQAITGAEALAAYRYRPNLERRNHVPKGPQVVAPVKRLGIGRGSKPTESWDRASTEEVSQRAA